MNHTLRALTTSALALPGFARSAVADAPAQDISAAYNYARYFEDAIPRSKLVAGTTTGERYEIDIHQLRFLTPLSDRFDLGVDLTYETMSGATPWYVDTSSGKALQVMTGATINEERTDALLASNYYLEKGRVGVSTGVSVENDYLAIYGGLSGERSLNDKHTTISGGAGFSYDTIEPVDADLFETRPDRERKQLYSGFAGISQVIDRRSQIQSTVNVQHAQGYLSDPYRLALVGFSAEADTRPDDRTQISWLTRYRRHFEAVDGTIHADYRLYLDDWGITSHTAELEWHQTLFDSIRLIPSLRYYSQTEAAFYALSYTVPRSDGLKSSDYRLSAYGALAGRLKAELFFRTRRAEWIASIGWERYLSSRGLALAPGRDENPGLVSYNLLSASIEVKF